MIDMAGNTHRLPEIRISVFAHNLPAVALYQSLGFETYDEEVRRDPFGGDVTLIHMRHLLTINESEPVSPVL